MVKHLEVAPKSCAPEISKRIEVKEKEEKFRSMKLEGQWFGNTPGNEGILSILRAVCKTPKIKTTAEEKF